MSILTSYKTNRPMREQYFRINGITHAEICDAMDSCDHIDSLAYKVMLTNGDGVGFWEDEEFSSIPAAIEWCATYAPELVIV